MTAKRLLGLSVGIVLIASCASMQGTKQDGMDNARTGPTRTFGQPHDVVWSATQEYMASRNWALGETNRDKGYIRSKTFTLGTDHDYAHCQSGRRSTVTGYDVEFEAWLTRISANGTSVAVDATISVAGGGRGDCASTGAIEEELFNGIDSVIAAHKPQ